MLCVSSSAAGFHNDTVRDDPLFSIPLQSKYITDPELKSVQLCFEVHEQSGNHYNLISDRCTSVTALYSAGVVNTEMNVITKIGVRTQGTSGTCHSVKVDLDNCSASLDGAYVNKSTTASVDGVRLSARQNHINYECLHLTVRQPGVLPCGWPVKSTLLATQYSYRQWCVWWLALR